MSAIVYNDRMNTTLPFPEEPSYLTDQLITYIGNKRSLLGFIERGITFVQKQTGKEKLSSFDVFSGSGIVSRFLKQYSSEIYTNDLEEYARIISSCYLSNKSEINFDELIQLRTQLINSVKEKIPQYLSKDKNYFLDPNNMPGFISDMYAPKNLNDIKKEERCFYTPYNACFLDLMRQEIDAVVPDNLKKFFIAPLLSEASIHANTGGVFKGFYKNTKTGIGRFGGTAENALFRIKGDITLELPVLSNYECPSHIFSSDANILAQSSDCPEVDLAYMDPPYNQHPYGSNYFMLNLLAKYEKPSLENISRVSGIPKDWHRSQYNVKAKSAEAFLNLVQNLKAHFLLISFNNEGFISENEMVELLGKVGKVTVLESPYTAFRASRNLSDRSIYVKEYLYVVEKH